jgi:hypothetical protein
LEHSPTAGRQLITQLGPGPFVVFTSNYMGLVPFLCPWLGHFGVVCNCFPFLTHCAGARPDGRWKSRWAQVVATCSDLSQEFIVCVQSA